MHNHRNRCQSSLWPNNLYLFLSAPGWPAFLLGLVLIRKCGDKRILVQPWKFCKSGLGKRITPTNAICILVTDLKVSIDDTVTLPPYPCKANGQNLCMYYQNSTKLFELPCECEFDVSTGYCPIPDQGFLNNYGVSVENMYNASRCHTLDRDNLYAQRECGIALTDKYEL
jgi:hypothetical protein